MRRPWTRLLLIVATVSALAASPSAQTSDPGTQTSDPGIQIPDPGTQTPAPAASDQKPPAPPAAVGEEGVKPTRGFLSALLTNLGDDVKHMPRWNSLFWITTGAVLAEAVHGKDRDINGSLVGSADSVWKAGAFVGQTPTLLSAAALTYVVGRTRHAPRAQHLGMDEIEAVLLADAFVLGLKQAVRRQRPLTPDGKTQSGFSFPSGHSTATFAAATVLQQHLGYRAGIPTYLVASYVAMSRLHDNKHFASDVAFGAGLGIVIGRSVTWHGRHFYGSPMLLPDGAGVLIALGPQKP